jgi:hypothetical protein
MESNPLINETLLQMKYARVVNLLADRLGITHPQALEVFYNSETYSHLSDLRNHLHNMSDAYLAEEIINEQQAE